MADEIVFYKMVTQEGLKQLLNKRNSGDMIQFFVLVHLLVLLVGVVEASVL
ncbi:MAG: hypothetical protein GY729_06295 [Desulfobacteraceae bacterium]|nr:hypothetical protein [Desulfobacteraceae bacterium]